MCKAPNTIREQLFQSEHLSYYNKFDTDTLDECRSVPPSGLVLHISNRINVADIDISKSFTSELTTHKLIPSCNTLGKWMEYDDL